MLNLNMWLWQTVLNIKKKNDESIQNIALIKILKKSWFQPLFDICWIMRSLHNFFPGKQKNHTFILRDFLRTSYVMLIKEGEDNHFQRVSLITPQLATVCRLLIK